MTSSVTAATRFVAQRDVVASVVSFLPLKEQAQVQLTCRGFRVAAEKAYRILLGAAKTQDFFEDCRMFSANTLHKPVSRKEILDQMPSITCLNLSDIWGPNEEPNFDENTWERLGAILSSVNAKKLTHLRVSLPTPGNYLTSECIQAISLRCLKLTKLQLRWSRITDDTTACLAGLPHLQEVSFYRSQNIGDKTAAVLVKMPSVTNICLSGCEKITDVGITNLLQNTPQLRTLDVGDSAGGHCGVHAQARIAQAIAAHGKQLVRLEMSRGYYANADVLGIAASCQNLTFIDLSGMCRETLTKEEELAQAMRKANPRLQILGLEPPAERKQD
ncbi:MAG: hypothetical protein ACHQT8_01025 [Chlamydiales bacterium]